MIRYENAFFLEYINSGRSFGIPIDFDYDFNMIYMAPFFFLRNPKDIGNIN